MPLSQAAIDQVLPMLQAVRPITGKKMFGGLGFYCDGVFFAVMDDDKLFFKVDDSNRAFYDDLNAGEWIIQGPQPQTMPYREVPDSVMADSVRLAIAIDAAVAVALRKKKASNPRKA
jgi:DNA transformation protein